MKICIWIHNHEILHEFIIWIQILIYDHEEYREIRCWNSHVWVYVWIHASEFILLKSYEILTLAEVHFLYWKLGVNRSI